MDLSAVRRVEAITRNLEPPPPPTFTTMTDVDIFCGTYNVNGKREKALALSWWLMQGWTTSAPHLFVITIQEMIDLSAANVVKETIADTRSKQAAEDWAAELRRAFGYVAAARPGCFDGATPQLIAEEHMVGIALFVFAWDETVLSSVEDLCSARIPTGAVGGRLGNKGACAVRFRLRASTLCFVGAHLSAHRGDVAGRNADYAAVVGKDCFSRFAPWRGDVDGDKAEMTASDGPPNPCRCDFGVLDHDVVVFAGDLNYRVDASLADREVQFLVRGDLPKLVALDQLNVERSAGRTFAHGFAEAPLTFLPTYKYATGTTQYDYEVADADGATNKKTRCPAWCDRVLWRAEPTGPRPADGAFAESVAASTYDRADDRLKVSDHRAVFALLTARLRDVDADARDAAGRDAAAAARGEAPRAPRADEQRGGFEVLTRPASLSAPPPASLAPATRRTSLSAPALPSPAPARHAGVDLDPPMLWLRAGVDAVSTITNRSREPVALALARAPPWARLALPLSLAPGASATLKAHAALDAAAKLALAEHGGLLAATATVSVDGAATHLLPVVVSATPNWPAAHPAADAPPRAPPQRASSVLAIPGIK